MNASTNSVRLQIIAFFIPATVTLLLAQWGQRRSAIPAETPGFALSQHGNPV
jgi:hypothetical protein